MTSKRFFVHPQTLRGEIARIEGAEALHLRRVLRLGVGDQVFLLAGDGTEYVAEIAGVEKEAVICRLLGLREVEKEPPVAVTLIQSLIKGEKNDFIVQKAVEIGVKRIVFVKTSRTVVNLDEGKARARVERWRRIAQEAAKQCGRVYVPTVEGVFVLEQWLAQAWPEEGKRPLFWVPWENAAGPEAGLEVQLNQTWDTREVYLLIGPEGGLALEEVELARRYGAIPVSLGPRILRAETAALVACTLVLSALGDLGR